LTRPSRDLSEIVAAEDLAGVAGGRGGGTIGALMAGSPAVIATANIGCLEYLRVASPVSMHSYAVHSPEPPRYCTNPFSQP
jgi:hypothetical protein